MNPAILASTLADGAAVVSMLITRHRPLQPLLARVGIAVKSTAVAVFLMAGGL